MAITGFICHDDYLAKTSKLTDEEVGRLFRALMIYHSTGEAPELQGRESVAFDFICEDINTAEQRYRDKCEQNRRNRLGAGDKDKEQPSTTDNDRQRPSTVETADKLPEVKGFMDDAEAQAIQGDHDRLLDAAKDAGFKGTNTENAALIQLYTQYGLQKVLDGFTSCVEHSAPNLAYLRAVLKGEPRKQTGKVLPAQNFQQRDYTEVEKEMQERQRERIIEMICRNNGLWDEANNKPVEGWREKMDQLKAEGKAV